MDGRPILEAPRIRRKLAELEVEAKAFEVLSLRALDNATKDPDGKRPDPFSSILKIALHPGAGRLQWLIVGFF